VPSAAAPPDPKLVDLTYWQSIKDSTDPGDYRSYLSAYPHGMFAALAANRLSSLTTSKPAPSESGVSWRPLGVKDCTGGDFGWSEGNNGTATPAHALCDQAHAGQIAVCWDGKTYTNPFDRRGIYPWCTYKTTTTDQCSGGGNPGEAFECR
jgi:hypothetical protein